MPEHPEYLPTGMAAPAETAQPVAATMPAPVRKGGALVFDFEAETLGTRPRTFVPVVGYWLIGQDGSNRMLVVDGRQWSKGQAAVGLAKRAHSLYGERYAEFLDNVKAFAYFPYAVATGIVDFRQGEISLRFKTIDGRIDQAAGILFDLKPNGDCLALRANALENNLVLWQFKRGKRSSLEWVRNTPTSARQRHVLKLIVSGSKVEGYIDGKHYLPLFLPHPVSDWVGIWSKADSVVYFDNCTVKALP